jgi:hypothetical protein
VRLLLLLSFAVAGAGCTRDGGISRELGAACGTDLDCDHRCLQDPRWPGGFCSLDCATTSACPVGADCFDTRDGEVCLFLCFDDRDCDFLDGPGRDGWKCRALGGTAGDRLACAPPEVSG